jgi:hypothetical protein
MCQNDTIFVYAQVYNNRRELDTAESEKRRDSLTINVAKPDPFVRYFGVSVFHQSQS